MTEPENGRAREWSSPRMASPRTAEPENRRARASRARCMPNSNMNFHNFLKYELCQESLIIWLQIINAM